MAEILSSLRDSRAMVRTFPPMNGWAIFNKCLSEDKPSEGRVPRVPHSPTESDKIHLANFVNRFLRTASSTETRLTELCNTTANRDREYTTVH
jgi:hypothetical protein